MKLLMFSALLVLGESIDPPILDDSGPPEEASKLLDEGIEDALIPLGYHSSVGVPAASIIRQYEEGAVTRIAGGHHARLGDYPYFGGVIITLESAATSVCGSSLLSPTRVLTAAHCWWDGREYAYSMQVVLGSVRLFSGGVRVFVIYVAAHAQYSPGVVTNDIAILSIPPVPISGRIKSINLPVSPLKTYEGYTAAAIGFGRTTDSAETISSELRQVLVPVISNTQCAATYGTGIITPGVMCTGEGAGAGNTGVCGGDSGGPLVLHNSGGNDVLIGVMNFVSSSSGCTRRLPAGYVRVSHHSKWIRAQM